MIISQFSTNNLLYLKTVEDRWVHAAMRLTSIEFSFDPCNIYRDCLRGVGLPRGKQKSFLKTLIRSQVLLKTTHSPPIYHYISEMVENRWVHAARRLTSIEFSFDPCNIYRDGLRGVGYPDARSVGDSHPSCYRPNDINQSIKCERIMQRTKTEKKSLSSPEVRILHCLRVDTLQGQHRKRCC